MLAKCDNRSAVLEHARYLSCGLVALDCIGARGLWSHAAGGSGSNVARTLAWLGEDSAVVGRIGDDAAGDIVLNDLRRSGVETASLVRDQDLSFRVIHQIDAGRHGFSMRCPLCQRRGPKRPRLTAAHVQTLESTPPPTWVFADAVSERLVNLLEKWSRMGTRLWWEPWRPPVSAAAQRLSALADVMKVSSDGPVQIMGSFGHAAQVRIVTNGSGGVCLRIGNGPWTHSPAPKVESVVDPAGAGDALTGSILAILARQRPTVEGWLRLVDRAQLFAARSTCFVGAYGMQGELRPDQVIEGPSAPSHTTPFAAPPRLLPGMSTSRVRRWRVTWQRS